MSTHPLESQVNDPLCAQDAVIRVLMSGGPFHIASEQYKRQKEIFVTGFPGASTYTSPFSAKRTLVTTSSCPRKAPLTFTPLT